MLDHSSQVNRAPLKERRGDCYDTPAVAVHALRKLERLPHRIWEPACGTGNIVTVLRAAGHDVIATDLNDRGCPNSSIRIDFLLPGFNGGGCDAIVTNPPFALAEKFVAASWKASGARQSSTTASSSFGTARTAAQRPSIGLTGEAAE